MLEALRGIWTLPTSSHSLKKESQSLITLIRSERDPFMASAAQPQEAEKTWERAEEDQ